MRLAFKIALRHLKAPQKAGFSRYAGAMAMTGLGLGIAALILTFAILEGFERTLSEKLTEFDGHVRIEHFMDNPVLQDDVLIDSALAKLAVEYRAFKYIQKPAILRSGPEAEGVLVEAYDRATDSPVLGGFTVEGHTTIADSEIVVGVELARKMDLEIGDRLVLFDLSNIHQIAAARRLSQFTVSGIYHSGLQDYDNTLVYVSLAAAQRLFNMDRRITGQVLFLENDRDVNAVTASLENDLGYPYFILSWMEKHRVLFNWMSIQKWPILIIFGLIALVGVVNIISALAMIVLEKIREIGILKSMGLTRRRIKLVFLFEGGIIGMVGSLGGTAAAVLLAVLQNRFQLFSIPEEIYFMDYLPVDLNLATIILFISAGTGAALLASLWPTGKAARIKPAGALRYE